MTTTQLKSLDYQYEDHELIPVNVGVGFKWKGKDGHDYESVEPRSRVNGKRACQLEQSSWNGISIGAMHYYASIEVPSPDIRDKAEPRILSCGGYGPEQPKEYLSRIKIEAKRRITKVEKDMNDEPIGKIGDMTYRFNDSQSAREAAIATFKARFAPGWVLVDAETGEPICET